VQACADGHDQRASLLLDVNTKQIGQLCRDWYAIVDVMDVRVATPTAEMLESATGLPNAHPPVSAGTASKNVSAAMA